jgi:hypothetical protein
VLNPCRARPLCGRLIHVNARSAKALARVSERNTMSPEARRIAKKIDQRLEEEKDPDERERLLLHKRRFDALRQLDINRTRAIAARLGIDPGDLPPDVFPQ